MDLIISRSRNSSLQGGMSKKRYRRKDLIESAWSSYLPCRELGYLVFGPGGTEVYSTRRKTT
jgi:hypothetical protein